MEPVPDALQLLEPSKFDPLAIQKWFSIFSENNNKNSLISKNS
jgi:hypothetical protein